MSNSKRYPDGLVPSDKPIEMLGNIIAEAYKQTFQIVSDGDYSKQSRRNAILRQLEDVVETSDKKVQSWVKVLVPGFYEKGMFEVTAGLSEQNVNPRIKISFDHFHREAIEALAQDAYANIATGMEGISNTGRRFVQMGTRQALTERIAVGQITGATVRDIKKQITAEFEKSGITGLIDKSGRTWQLDRYAEMLARTKLTQSYNTAVVNRMVEAGQDLVMVSSHANSCKLCAPFQGTILSVTGKDARYMSLDRAIANGLFHPNCRHQITPYHSIYLHESVIWNGKDYVPFKDYQKMKDSSVDYANLQTRQTAPDAPAKTFKKADVKAVTDRAFEAHKEVLTDLGIITAIEFTKLLERSSKRDLIKWINDLPDSDSLKQDLLNIADYL